MDNSNNNKQKQHPTFGKIMLASGVGTLIVLLIVGIVKLLIFFGLIGSMASEKAGVKSVTNDSFLEIDLTEAMFERTPSDYSSLLTDNSSVGFSDLLRAIGQAADDPKIKGICLNFGMQYPHSWGRSEELRQALTRFCESDKPVLAYAEQYTQQGYFVASVADSVYLNPTGMLEFRGLGAEALFYKEMLDRLGVKLTLVRPKSNDYKTAGEAYTMNHMSDANRRQVREYLCSIWDYVTEQVAEARDIASDTLNRLADNLDALLPDDALKTGMVDRLCFEKDMKYTIKHVLGASHTVKLKDYVGSLRPQSNSKNRIAVLYAEGTVQTGTGFQQAVYSDKLVKDLCTAAHDDNVKAIVLRVNSPGGAVIASESITNAVRHAKAKKPLVVSMGDVAASAGYEMSCYADYIVAQPTTITGSIGVFATLPEVGGTLRKYLGITTDTVCTNRNSTALSILRPLSPRALELTQRSVEEFYTTFVGRVAEARGLDSAFVDSVARGRVWTGSDALRLGLVDALGGLDDAVQVAAERAGVSDYQVVDYPANKDFLSELKERKDNSSIIAQYGAEQAPALPAPLPAAAGDGVWVPGHVMLNTLNEILDTRGLQARVEFFLLTD
ncbi:MAG: signal peptide peptidase SppA [Bacteroidales bacterium]|nr:signal peptide peptidase SppA [Bacteroidales bacterium]